MSKRLLRQEVPGSMEDKRLHLIRLLYGEALPNGVVPEEDPELAAEWRALQEVKGWLDARPRRRPDPAVIDRIVAAAARPVAADRPARRGLRRWRWRVAAGALTLLVMVGGVWYRFWTDEPLERPGVVVAEQVPTTPEPVELQPWLHLMAQTEADARSEPPQMLLRWDDREAVQQIYRQLQLLEARSTPEWEPALPLETWPTGSGRPGLVPASRRNH